MFRQCLTRGLCCASRGAFRTNIRPLALRPRPLQNRRDLLSTQVQVADTDTEREVNAKVAKLADEILELNLLEISDLSSILKDRLGLDAIPMAGAMPMAAPAAAATGGAAAPAEEAPPEEKASFDLKLESFDKSAKIKVIKEVRAVTELGLKEAKDMVEKAPVVVKEGLDKKSAEEIKKQLEEVGAVVSLE